LLSKVLIKLSKKVAHFCSEYFYQNSVPGLFHGMSLKPRSSAKIKMTFGLLELPFATRNAAKNDENRSIAAGFLSIDMKLSRFYLGKYLRLRVC